MSDPEVSEFTAERIRAHHKHRGKPGGSMEMKDWDAPDWSDVLGEELGEVNRARNDRRHGLLEGDEYKRQLRKELVQLGAMTEAWIAAIDETQLDDSMIGLAPGAPDSVLTAAHHHATQAAHLLREVADIPGPWILHPDGDISRMPERL